MGGSSALLNGNSSARNSDGSPWPFLVNPRSPGRLPSCPNSPHLSSVPAFLHLGPSFSVSGSAFQPEVSPSGVHQGGGNIGGFLTSSGCPSLPIPG